MAEVRLIDANVLLALFDERLDGAQIQVATRRDGKTLWTGIYGGVNWGRNTIIEAPTIDPESLRPKGRWVMKETMIRSPHAKNAYCSECLEETRYAHKFCPNCGADMREDGK